MRLKDVATVKIEYPDLTKYVTVNGTKALLLSVTNKEGTNISTMGSAINKKLEHIKADLPADVHISKITDQKQVVDDSIYDFLRELLIAICSVLLVVVLIMPRQVAAVAAATMPITIFISLGLFYIFDLELNTVTLAALIMTLGMIVDDSIVIIDGYVNNLAAHAPVGGSRRGDEPLPQEYLLGYAVYLYHLLPVPHHDDGRDARLPEDVPVGYLDRALREYDHRADATAYSDVFCDPQAYRDRGDGERQESLQPPRCHAALLQ